MKTANGVLMCLSVSETRRVSFRGNVSGIRVRGQLFYTVPVGITPFACVHALDGREAFVISEEDAIYNPRTGALHFTAPHDHGYTLEDDDLDDEDFDDDDRPIEPLKYLVETFIKSGFKPLHVVGYGELGRHLFENVLPGWVTTHVFDTQEDFDFFERNHVVAD